MMRLGIALLLFFAVAFMDAAPRIEFPKDNGAHNDVSEEWWYYTGKLKSDAKEYGFELAIFQFNQKGNRVFLGHCALTDLTDKKFIYDGIMGENKTLKQPSEGLWFTMSNWELKEFGKFTQMKFKCKDKEIDFVLFSETNPVEHGENGIVKMGKDGGTSYYYSKLDEKLIGTIKSGKSGKNEKLESVSGTAWMDHQWGDFKLSSFQGWDWWGIRLENNAKIMIYRFRDFTGNPELTGGTVIDEAGTIIRLNDGDIQLSGEELWKSKKSKANYPLNWTISIPSAKLKISTRTSVMPQELSLFGESYWEGLMDVAGVYKEKPITGMAYQELTGYAPKR